MLCGYRWRDLGGPSSMVRAGSARVRGIIPRRSARRVVRSLSELQFNPGLISSTIHLIGTDVVQFPRVSQEAFQSRTLRSVSQRHPSSHDAQSQGRDASSRAGSVWSPDQRLVTLLFRIRTNTYLKPPAKFSCPNRRRSSARFFTDIAAVKSLLTTCVVTFFFFLIHGILCAQSSVDTGRHCRPSTSFISWSSTRLFCRSLDIQRSRPPPQCGSWAVSLARGAYNIALRTTLSCAAQPTFVLGFQRRHLSWYHYCSF
jgi:hypothetical protein